MDVLKPQRPRAWAPHAVLLGFSAAVLLAAALLEPSNAQVSLFGVPIPSMCMWRNLLGVSCPGCGMTRSFTFLAHGDALEALRMNPLGPLLFAFLAAQVPYRAWVVWRLVTPATDASA